MKKGKSLLAKNICIIMPCIEEISKKEMLPYCLIGAKPNNDKIDLSFSLPDEIYFPFVYQFCESFVNAHKNKYEKLQAKKLRG